MIADEPWQGKPAVGDFRSIDASYGQHNQAVIDDVEALDWAALVQFVQEPHQASVTHSYYIRLPKTDPDDPNNCQAHYKRHSPWTLFGSCQNNKRNDANLTGRSALTLDFDQRDSLRLLKTLPLERLPFSYVWHTTRSHDLNIAADRVQPKLRVIIPLSRDVTLAEYRPLCETVARLFFPNVTLDPACLKPSQMMYSPVQNKGGPYRSGAARIGGYLVPDSVLVVADVKTAVESERKRVLATDDDGSVDPLVNAKQPKKGIGLREIERDLDRLDPNMEYEHWRTVILAVHHQTMGSEDGFELVDTWSQGGATYKDGEVRTKWDELKHSPSKEPITYGTILSWMNEQRAAKAVAVRDTFILEIQNCNDENELEVKLPTRISQSDELTPLGRKRLAEELVKRQKAVFGTALSIAEVRKAVAPVVKPTAVTLSSGAVATREYTQFGNTDRLADAYGDRLIYVPQLDSWFEWNKAHWKPTTTTHIEAYAQKVLRGMGREADAMSQQQAQAHYDWMRKSHDSAMVSAMVRLLASRPGMTKVDANELDANPWLLGVQNGIINLKTGKFHDSHGDDLITLVCSVDYDAKAQCPLFEKVVADALNNDEQMIAWFQRLMGYTILGQPNEQFMVIPYGNGSNGKGTILNAIREVLGDHARNAKASTFLDDGRNAASGPNEDLLRLKGSRFVFMSEPEAGQQFRTGLVKTVTGGDAVTARAPYGKRSIEFVPTWVIVMPTNHKPVIKDTDDGIWRRMKLIPFVRKFDDKTKDRNLAQKLRDEYEGILAWLVSGATQYLRDGLGDDPPSVAAAHASYRTDMDVLHEWLEDNWVADPLGRVSMTELWGNWKRYAEQSGYLSMVASEKSLGRRLIDKGFRPYRSNGKRGYTGLTRRERSAEDEGFK